MTTKHTPGPWGVCADHPTIIKQFDFLGETSVLVASVCGHPNSGFFPTEEEQAHNARLIAAAPELLEALKGLVDYDSYQTEYDGRMHTICPSCGEQDGEHRPTCEFVLARAVIAKATGAA